MQLAFCTGHNNIYAKGAKCPHDKSINRSHAKGPKKCPHDKGPTPNRPRAKGPNCTDDKG